MQTSIEQIRALEIESPIEENLSITVHKDAEVDSHHERSKDSLIMLVDDEPILMELVQVFLQERGYHRFVTCDQSTEALELIAQKTPDVLLLDLVMPEVTGFDILTALRAELTTRHLPIIVLTSSSDSETKLKALEMGATDFLAKPVDPSELALRLRNTLMVKAYQDRLTNYDQLTGLPNRKLFIERLGWAMRRTDHAHDDMCLLLVGIDRFKHINDALGPTTGDEVLRQFGARLKYAAGDEESVLLDNIARLGSDEFSILLETGETKNVNDVAQQILSDIAYPFKVDDQEVFVRASIGISMISQAETVDELLQHASLAQKYAKQNGGKTFQMYSAEIDAEATAMLQMENDLRYALENKELELFYQPKVDAKTKKIIGMEALIRWFRRGEMVSPVNFIPLAEDTGLIVPIGEWILAKACNKAKALQEMGFDIKVSVNVSARQIADANLSNAIRDALTLSQLSPDKLMLEITESVIMDHVEEQLAVLHAIKALGISLSIDDFGTGYSSLSYLKRFPIDELKIDRSFLMELPDDDDDAAIVRAILALAHSLGLYVTAEGVETEEQSVFLAEHDCEIFQGYYFSKPLPFDTLCQFCRDQAK